MNQPTSTRVGSFEAVYTSLRSQARHYLRREQNACSISPTALVHDAWLALARSKARDANDRRHYVRLLSRIMKNLLIDHARAKKAVSNGGAAQHIQVSATASIGEFVSTKHDAELILSVAAGLENLQRNSPRLAALVQLRFFSGLTEREVATALGISVRTVRRQWRVARVRLLESFQPAAGETNK